jgi:hypothetical protein
MTKRPPGQPVIENGQYGLNNHGAHGPISRDEYVPYAEDDQRSSASFALPFYPSAALVVAVTVDRLGWAARQQEDSKSAGSGQESTAANDGATSSGRQPPPSDDAA